MSERRKSTLRARALRRAMTPPERRLWNVLRLRPEELKFRPQHPFGPYTLDFFCREAGLAIEVDGIAHDMGDRPQRDAVRDQWLSKSNIEVVRVPAVELKHDLEGVVLHILSRCNDRRPPPPGSARSPSPRNRGEENDQQEPLE